jgi:hypothetical protein
LRSWRPPTFQSFKRQIAQKQNQKQKLPTTSFMINTENEIEENQHIPTSTPHLSFNVHNQSPFRSHSRRNQVNNTNTISKLVRENDCNSDQLRESHTQQSYQTTPSQTQLMKHAPFEEDAIDESSDNRTTMNGKNMNVDGDEADRWNNSVPRTVSEDMSHSMVDEFYGRRRKPTI